MPMMSYPRESQNQFTLLSAPMSSTNSGYISDDSLAAQDLPFPSDTYFDPTIPYHFQADWLRSSSTPPLSSQSSYTGSCSDSTIFSPSTLYSPTYSRAPSPTLQTTTQPPTFQSAAEKLAYQTSRRRAQNRESQRAFRERKDHQIAELEAKLAELQGRYEKLQLHFVELSGRVVTTTGRKNEYNSNF